ncbi:MAG: Type 1 glutamine amidotransferase-like domain-containing protein [Candidatus Paceibacterota bacterium]
METNNKSLILLTSTGLSYQETDNYVNDFCKSKSNIVSIVVTASEDKKENKYVKLAIEQFKELGIEKINLIDLEIGEVVPKETTILYVSGGNTFKLMHHVRKSNFIDSIKNTLSQNGLYIGVSAGSIIVGNSIESAGDENTVGLDNFTGLGLIDFSIFPHSNEETKLEVTSNEKFKNPIFIRDDQAFLIELSGENVINSKFI